MKAPIGRRLQLLQYLEIALIASILAAYGLGFDYFWLVAMLLLLTGIAGARIWLKLRRPSKYRGYG